MGCCGDVGLNFSCCFNGWNNENMGQEAARSRGTYVNKTWGATFLHGSMLVSRWELCLRGKKEWHRGRVQFTQRPEDSKSHFQISPREWSSQCHPSHAQRKAFDLVSRMSSARCYPANIPVPHMTPAL